MLLPEYFVFTQQNLQDYVDCQYRFYLRNIHKLEWPAIESEPIRELEELMLLGTRFHLLCQQYFSGIPVEVLNSQIMHPELEQWWKNILLLGLQPNPKTSLVEKLISIPFAGFRLTAKFDLLLCQSSEKVFIYDWKTSQHQPKRQTLLERMQSKVYPLVTANTNVKNSCSASSLSMIYWYPAFPNSPISFAYSESQYKADQTQLEMLVAEIAGKTEDEFKKTDKDKVCTYCRFRSLCNRGIAAGIVDSLDEIPISDNPFNLDFDAL